ncbi:uncharacterized protein LOC144579912 [Callithrix jacchus]
MRPSLAAPRRIRVSGSSRHRRAPNPAFASQRSERRELRPRTRGPRPLRVVVKRVASPIPEGRRWEPARRWGRGWGRRSGRAARRRGGAAAIDGGAHQPGAGWQEPHRGWPERVAGARRRGSRVAASSWAPLSRGGGGGGRVFLCLHTSLAGSCWYRGRGGAGRAALQTWVPLPRAVCSGSFGPVGGCGAAGVACAACPGILRLMEAAAAAAAAAAGLRCARSTAAREMGKFAARRPKARRVEPLCRELGPL